MMLQEFRRLPEPLQKQVLTRLGLGAVFFLIMLALLIAVRDAYLWLPCAGAAASFAAAAFLLLRSAALGEYVVVSGGCAEVRHTAIKRRVKYFILRTDSGDLKVIPRGSARKVRRGAAVRLYVSKNTPVYEENGTQILYTYMALEIE